MVDKNVFRELKSLIQKEKNIVKELVSSSNHLQNADKEEKKILISHLNSLKVNLRKINDEIPESLGKIHLIKSLPSGQNFQGEQKNSNSNFQDRIINQHMQNKNSDVSLEKTPKQSQTKNSKGFFEKLGIKKLFSKDEFEPDLLEKETIKRMKLKQGKKKEVKEKEQKANPYIKYANKLFSKFSKKLVSKNSFSNLETDLIKANMKYTPHSYISVIFLSTVISFFVGTGIFLFFLFFNLNTNLPIVSFVTEPLFSRLVKIFWIPIIVPIGTFLVMLFFPSLEKGSKGFKIDEEVPFATIHMSAISGSLIDPSQIFRIMITTKEYPHLEKEFTKLINEINIYGYDLVSALKNASQNSPSKKLSELYNGLATTINSGGSLFDFFEKRSQTLLFEHSIEKEKKTKAAETYMDIYISVVIAAPMILMMLLMMMKISGLGLSLSTTLITLIIGVTVTTVNIIFLTFLDLKK